MKHPWVSSQRAGDLSLTWRNISYVAQKRRNYGNHFGLQQVEFVQLLNGVGGIVRSGTLMAIMGPSGAGKTTLLATISMRIKGERTGHVFLNGEAVDKGQMIRISGFVPQQDLAVESLTVQEHMEFMACMRMDRRFRTADRKRRIATLLAELGLAKSAATKLSSLSGGERKRVSLAVQLLTEPSILFCDEPTTGLDSYGAMTVARTLRDVAARKRIVVCSLHQPASGLLDVFHEILLLSAGRVAFQGTAASALEFFGSLGLRCPPTYNSAEFFVSQLSVIRGREKESYKKVTWICDQFDGSKYGKSVATAIEDSCKDDADRTTEKLPSILSSDFRKIRSFTQFKWLTWRTCVDYKRNSSSLLLRFILYMSLAILLASPYVDVTKELNQGSIQNAQGFMYLVVVETVFTFNYGVFYTFPRELPLLLRDIAAGLYGPAPYYFSKVAVLVPGAIFQPFLFSVVVYAISGLDGGFTEFVYFTIPIILCAISASALGCFMSAAFKSVDTASLLSVPIDFMSLIFCGIYLHLGNLSPAISWLRYLSQFYYGLEAISLIQWQHIERINCSADPEEPCVSTGLGVLEKYGYIPDHYAVDVIGLLAIFAISHFAGFLVIRHRSRKEPVY